MKQLSTHLNWPNWRQERCRGNKKDGLTHWKAQGQRGEVERSWTFLDPVNYQLVRDLPMKSEHFGLAISGLAKGQVGKTITSQKNQKGSKAWSSTFPGRWKEECSEARGTWVGHNSWFGETIIRGGACTLKEVEDKCLSKHLKYIQLSSWWARVYKSKGTTLSMEGILLRAIPGIMQVVPFAVGQCCSLVHWIWRFGYKSPCPIVKFRFHLSPRMRSSDFDGSVWWGNLSSLGYKPKSLKNVNGVTLTQPIFYPVMIVKINRPHYFRDGAAFTL